MSISTVTSEALQLKLRELLPSQQGFGTDLSASDTIIPIIDLTRAAEGSDIPQILQIAQSFGSQTVFSANNSTATIANTPGFYIVQAIVSLYNGNAISSVTVDISDGASTKTLYKYTQLVDVNSDPQFQVIDLEFVAFLQAGDSLSTTSANNRGEINGSVRQIANVNGVLTNPSGFSPQ